MDGKQRNYVVALVSALLMALSPKVASAAWETALVRNASSPVALTRCEVVPIFSARLAVENRTSHQMISFNVKYQFYDADNVLIGTGNSHVVPDETLAPGVTAAYFTTVYLSGSIAEPISALARVTCRMDGASFSGQKKWTYGQPWREPLKSARAPEGQGADSSAAGSADGTAGTDRALRMRVANAWNDNVNGVLVVHDTVVLEGGPSEARVSPSDFVLSMLTAGGVRKTYHALANEAPTYQKFNALTKQNSLAYEVDPQSDLGRLGTIVIPAHATVQVTVSFSVGDPVADPNANRTVALR